MVGLLLFDVVSVYLAQRCSVRKELLRELVELYRPLQKVSVRCGRAGIVLGDRYVFNEVRRRLYDL